MENKIKKDKLQNYLAEQKLHRIEALSDGVFSIAMTLLVLDLKIPLSATVNSEMELLFSLSTIGPKLLSYFLSFLTLGIFWTGHTTQFTYIARTDRLLNWFTILFLMFVSLLPFTTAFLSEHISFRLAIGLYWLNLFFIGTFLLTNWIYAWKKGYILDTLPEPEEINKAIRKRIITAQLLYAAGALLCFFNNYVSIFAIVFTQLYRLIFYSHKIETRRL